MSELADKELLRRALVVAPPSVQGSGWTRRLGDYGAAFASGWMQLRGARRRRGVERGFVLSDHADWPGLQRAIAATGAGRVIVTHGYEAVMVRWLQQQGLEAGSFRTQYGDDAIDDDAAAGHAEAASGAAALEGQGAHEVADVRDAHDGRDRAASDAAVVAGRASSAGDAAGPGAGLASRDPPDAADDAA